MDIFDTLIYQPFSWLLLNLYNLTSSYGLAIILFCLLTKLVLLPFSMKSKKGMMKQTMLQPKLAEAQKNFPNDKQRQQQEIAKIYQDAGVSPLGGCLWSLLPFPIFIALFAVVREPVTRLMGLAHEAVDILNNTILPALGLAVENQGYAELEIARHIHENFDRIQAYVTNPANAGVLNGVDFSGLRNIDFSFLGLDLTVTPTLWPLSFYLIIPILSGAAAYFSQWMSQKSMAQSGAPKPAGSNNMIMKLMPLMSVWFGFIMPSAMGVYWVANSLFGMAQDYVLGKHYGKKFAEEQAIRDAELEKRRLIEEAEKEELQKKREQNRDYQKQLAKEQKRAEFAAKNQSAGGNTSGGGGRPKKGKKKSGAAHSAAERIAAQERARLARSTIDETTLDENNTGSASDNSGDIGTDNHNIEN